MLDKGKISAFQIGLLLYPSVLTSGFLALPSTTYQLARNDLWLTSVPAVLIGLLTVYLATRLHALYPNQTIVQYGERILGKVPGKLLGDSISSYTCMPSEASRENTPNLSSVIF